MAPLMVSKATGGPGAHARTGESAHSASKTLSQRKICPQQPVQARDERRSMRSLYPAGPDPLDFRPRSQYLHRRKNKQAKPVTLYFDAPQGASVLFLNGETMSRKSLLSLVSAALLCFALPAWAQKSSSEGKGKELAD